MVDAGLDPGGNGGGSGGGSGGGANGSINFEAKQYYYHGDHLGSSSYITDIDGEVHEHLEYFPFGETWVHEKSNTQLTPYYFTGKELDEATGLYYFGARYYDPRTSVWQSPDPALDQYLEGKINIGVYKTTNLSLYSYSYNNPVTYHDPDGEFVNLIVGAATSVALGYGISLLTGDDYSLADAGRDALLGAAGAGVVSKARQLYQARNIAAPLSTKLAAKSGKAAQAEINSGIYYFEKAGEKYVGQGNIPARLSTHVANPSKPITSADDAVRASVRGGTASREVAEQLTLNNMGGKAGQGVVNVRNPIGPARQGLLQQPGLGVVDKIATPAQSVLTPILSGTAAGAAANADSFISSDNQPQQN
nr:RHS repeat-associated core domain-containing protein [Vibrio sp. S9_S30]